MSKYTYPAVVPQLVEDKNLKSSIINTTSALRVTPTTSADLTPLGETDDVAWNGTDPDATVISLLKGIVNKVTNQIPTVTKITNKDGVDATYLGTYDGVSTTSGTSSTALLVIMDRSTYNELTCWTGAFSVTMGSDYTGAKIYQIPLASGYGYRFSFLNDNNEVLYELQDGRKDDAGNAWSTISKKCLLFNL